MLLVKYLIICEVMFIFMLFFDEWLLHERCISIEKYPCWRFNIFLRLIVDLKYGRNDLSDI